MTQSRRHPATWWWIAWSLLLCAASPHAFAADPVDWRYERMWPELEQPWYFNLPTGVAVSADGVVTVADTENHRIQQFSATGEFLRAWGRLGNGEGEFHYPYGVAVSADGVVTVADTDNHRIQQFSATGEFLRAWGGAGQWRGRV